MKRLSAGVGAIALVAGGLFLSPAAFADEPPSPDSTATSQTDAPSPDTETESTEPAATGGDEVDAPDAATDSTESSATDQGQVDTPDASTSAEQTDSAEPADPAADPADAKAVDAGSEPTESTQAATTAGDQAGPAPLLVTPDAEATDPDPERPANWSVPIPPKPTTCLPLNSATVAWYVDDDVHAVTVGGNVADADSPRFTNGEVSFDYGPISAIQRSCNPAVTTVVGGTCVSATNYGASIQIADQRFSGGPIDYLLTVDGSDQSAGPVTLSPGNTGVGHVSGLAPNQQHTVVVQSAGFEPATVTFDAPSCEITLEPAPSVAIEDITYVDGSAVVTIAITNNRALTGQPTDEMRNAFGVLIDGVCATCSQGNEAVLLPGESGDLEVSVPDPGSHTLQVVSAGFEDSEVLHFETTSSPADAGLVVSVNSNGCAASADGVLANPWVTISNVTDGVTYAVHQDGLVVDVSPTDNTARFGLLANGGVAEGVHTLTVVGSDGSSVDATYTIPMCLRPIISVTPMCSDGGAVSQPVIITNPNVDTTNSYRVYVDGTSNGAGAVGSDAPATWPVSVSPGAHTITLSYYGSSIVIASEDIVIGPCDDGGSGGTGDNGGNGGTGDNGSSQGNGNNGGDQGTGGTGDHGGNQGSGGTGNTGDHGGNHSGDHNHGAGDHNQSDHGGDHNSGDHSGDHNTGNHAGSHEPAVEPAESTTTTMTANTAGQLPAKVQTDGDQSLLMLTGGLSGALAVVLAGIAVIVRRTRRS